MPYVGPMGIDISRTSPAGGTDMRKLMNVWSDRFLEGFLWTLNLALRVRIYLLAFLFDSWIEIESAYGWTRKCLISSSLNKTLQLKHSSAVMSAKSASVSQGSFFWEAGTEFARFWSMDKMLRRSTLPPSGVSWASCHRRWSRVQWLRMNGKTPGLWTFFMAASWNIMLPRLKIGHPKKKLLFQPSNLQVLP